MYHEVGFLWPIHAVHHSVENLDWLAGSRGHFIQVFSERAMVMVPLYLLGVDERALNIYERKQIGHPPVIRPPKQEQRILLY